MSKIVVTGAFSYTGKYITRHLLNEGAQVITLTTTRTAPIRSKAGSKLSRWISGRKAAWPR